MRLTVESVIDSHDDHILVGRKAGSVICRRRSRVRTQISSVNPEHDCFFLIVMERRRPNIQVQAVLTLRWDLICRFLHCAASWHGMLAWNLEGWNRWDSGNTRQTNTW